VKARRWVFWILLASFAGGIPLLIVGALMNNPAAAPDASGVEGAPYIAAAAVMILVPLLTAAVRIAIAIIRAAHAEHRRYRAWKSTLSPQERAAVQMAEAAAMWALHLRLREHHKRVQHEQTVSALGYDPATPPSQRPDPFSRNNPYWKPPHWSEPPGSPCNSD